MAGEVNVTSLSSGVPIAADLVGTVHYQQIKVLDGTPGGTLGALVTSATPAAGAPGVAVWLAPGQSLNVSVSIPPVSVSLPLIATQANTTGLPIWLAPTQTINATVNTAPTVAGASVTAQVSGTVSLSGTQVVTLATGGTLATLLGTVQVSGAISVSAMPAVSGTVSVSNTVVVTLATGATIATLLGAVNVSGAVSVSAMPAVSISVSAVLGTVVTVLGTVAVNLGSQATGVYTTTATSGATGPIVWLGASQSVIVSTQVSGTVSVSNTVVVTLATGGTIATLLGAVNISGAVSVSVLPAVSISVSAVLGTVVTVLGTQVVSVVPGVSVNIGSQATGVYTTTATSGVTGPIVWLGANQTVATVSTVSTLLGTINVNLAAAGTTIPVNVVAGGAAPGTTALTQSAISAQVVWLAPTQTMSLVSTIVTVLGTQVVTVVPGVSVNLSNFGSVAATTTASGLSGVTGLPVWIANPTTVTVTIAGTTTGTVSLLSIVPVTTQTSVSVSGVPVWFNPGALVSVSGTAVVTLATGGTVATLLGTVVVTLATGGTIATLLGAVNISGAVSVSVLPAVSISVSAVLGTVVTVLGTVTVSIATGANISTVFGTAIVTLATAASITALDVGRTNVMMTMLSSSVGISGSTTPFGLYIGTSTPVSGTTSFVVPAGKVFRVLAMNLIAQNSVTTAAALVRAFVVCSGALPTWTSTVPVMAQVGVQAVSATVSYSGCAVGIADIPAGATVALAYSIGTSGASIVNLQVNGYLFP